MRRVYGILLCLGLFAVLGPVSVGDEFKLTDGTTIWGTVSDSDETGIVFRLDSGGFSQRISWSKFSDPTLEVLARDPEMREFAEPFIPVPPDARPPVPRVVIRDYEKVELPAGKTGLLSSVTSPIGLLILALLYAGNLLAAFEVAIYRNRPVAVVCGVSAVLPVVGPAAFLASPSLELEGGEAYDEGAAEFDAEAGPAVAEAGTPGGTTSRQLGKVAPAASGLKVAAGQKSGAAAPAEKKVFSRGEFTFNRRFIETQFSGFFRVVPLEAEKDLVMVVKTPKQEYIAKRVTRISASEMFLQPIQVGTKEVKVPLGEIAQIIIRHKDDRG
ncbi:MAG: hypothetical protein H7A46_17460 [Verrucomicrobiales bacterium]|nr:hypothetical protein [Verrucomicrobiales bacterium]